MVREVHLSTGSFARSCTPGLPALVHKRSKKRTCPQAPGRILVPRGPESVFVQKGPPGSWCYRAVTEVSLGDLCGWMSVSQ